MDAKRQCGSAPPIGYGFEHVDILLRDAGYEGVSRDQRFAEGAGGSMLSIAKARFVFRRSGIGEVQGMIDRQVAVLTLLLAACNRWVDCCAVLLE